MNSLINDSSEKTLSLRPFTQPHLACICNRFVVGHFNAVYSSNTIGRLRVFVSPESFLQVWQTSLVFCSITGGQSASLSSCRVSIQSSQPPVHSVYKFRFQRLDNEFSDIPQFILLPVGVFCTFFTKINPFLTMKQLYLLDKALRNQAVGVTKVPV